MAELHVLRMRLEALDQELRVRGKTNPTSQAELLRLRRETLLEIKDAERAFWGS